MPKGAENQSNLPMSAERLRALDPEFWTDERVEQQMRQWSYRIPSDPDELLAHARKASAYEHELRGLNYDRSEGLISEEEYQARAQQANERHFGTGSEPGQKNPD